MPFLFQYQGKAEVLDAGAPPPTAPDQPWLLLDPPMRARRGVPGSGVLPPAIALPYDYPLLDPPVVVRRRRQALGEGSPLYGQADPVVTPDLIALALVSPMARPRRVLDSGGGQLPILAPEPFAGDLTSTHVQGTLPCAIIPSGMTPGDDSDG